MCGYGRCVTKKGKSHDVASTSNSASWLEDIDLTSSFLSESEKSSLATLLIEYRDVFVTSGLDLGRAHRFTHKIETGDNVPFHQRPYRILQRPYRIRQRHTEFFKGHTDFFKGHTEFFKGHTEVFKGHTDFFKGCTEFLKVK